ncbi:MAG: XRE family transcriptional regulator [Dehalococcoidia bacterium]|nr:XRE family transcriptional regulator [Dehalococcoidia bacterium]
MTRRPPGKPFDAVLNEWLADPEFKAEYDRLGPEFELRRALIELRHAAKLSQQQVAERVGTTREYISALERGPSNMSLGYLVRLMDALGADVGIRIRRRGLKSRAAVTQIAFPLSSVEPAKPRRRRREDDAAQTVA